MDISDLKEILRILEAQDITEFELEQDGVKLRVCRRSAATAGSSPTGASAPVAAAITTPPAAPAPGAPASPSPAVAAPAEPPANGTLVKSPIVGTFYRSPDPNSPPFVSVGDRVKVGQVLCIIEAMKLMNEIEADMAGKVAEILVENGQPVEFGQALFRIEPV